MIFMQQSNDAWITMYRRIPASLHDTLAVTLRTGTEIVIQKLLKLEPEFAIVRGRVSGTQDSGRVVLIPYDQMSFMSITRMLKDPEVEAIFGKGAPPALADLPTAPAAEPEAAIPETLLESAVAEEPKAPAPKRPEQMSKTALVAKLRERLKESN